MEASKASSDPEEVIDLQDDHLMHRDETDPQPESELEEVLTNDIEKDPPPKSRAKKPRTKAQQEAFKKAQAALKAKREASHQNKTQSKGAASNTKNPISKKPKKVIVEDSSDSDYSTESSGESEQEVVYVQRKKRTKKPNKPKKPPKVVYVTDSDDDEMPSAAYNPHNWFNFV